MNRTPSPVPVVRGTAHPSDLPAAFMNAFNAGEFDAVAGLFAPHAVRVLPGGLTLTGPARLDPTRELHRSGARLRLEVGGCFVADDTALLLTRSEILRPGTGPGAVQTAIDVARRVAGRWVYLIDNPTAVGLGLG